MPVTVSNSARQSVGPVCLDIGGNMVVHEIP